MGHFPSPTPNCSPVDPKNRESSNRVVDLGAEVENWGGRDGRGAVAMEAMAEYRVGSQGAVGLLLLLLVDSAGEPSQDRSRSRDGRDGRGVDSTVARPQDLATGVYWDAWMVELTAESTVEEQIPGLLRQEVVLRQSPAARAELTVSRGASWDAQWSMVELPVGFLDEFLVVSQNRVAKWDA